MKLLLILALFSFFTADAKTVTEKIVKLRLAYKGMENTGRNGELVFVDKNNRSFRFNAQHSKTTPYIFYSKASDGSLVENEKIKGSWFLISYIIFGTGREAEKVIVKVEDANGKKSI